MLWGSLDPVREGGRHLGRGVRATCLSGPFFLFSRIGTLWWMSSLSNDPVMSSRPRAMAMSGDPSSSQASISLPLMWLNSCLPVLVKTHWLAVTERTSSIKRVQLDFVRPSTGKPNESKQLLSTSFGPFPSLEPHSLSLHLSLHDPPTLLSPSPSSPLPFPV